MAETLRVGSPPITVELRRSARARRLILRVLRPGGTAVMTLPPRVALAAARRFAEAEEAWLRRELAAMPAAVAVGPGTVLPFAGGRLEIAEGARIGCEGALLRVQGPNHGARVAGFLRSAARDRLAEAVDRHTAALGLRHRRMALRDPRTRWGSCTSAGDLMFSWRLVMAPEAVLDYVAAHEVAHLAEMNHGPRFWALVAGLAPDHTPHRRWLKQHGPGLHLFRFGAA